jgi:nitrogen fixation NifU-like protein
MEMEEVVRYSQDLLNHYEKPRTTGELDATAPHVGTGVVGSPACGDVIKLQIFVDAEERIQNVRFKTFGCGSAIAVSSLLTERIKGKTLEETQKIRNADLSEALSLPEIKRHCSVLAEEVLAAAIQDFRRKQAGMDTENASSAPALTFTPRAVAKAQTFLTQKTPPAAGLRISVVHQGCAGLSYVLECAESRKVEEIVIEIGSIQVFVDPLVLPFLQGTQIDYVEENFKAGFVFNNPNACAQCACGQSFQTTQEKQEPTPSGYCRKTSGCR